MTSFLPSEDDLTEAGSSAHIKDTLNAGALESASASSFLAKKDSGHKQNIWYGLNNKSPLLGEARIRLLYQTPDVYWTDVAKQLFPAKLGFRYACKMPHEFGEVGSPPKLHPGIVFNKQVRNIHIHLEDTKTGDVFWDADFKLPMGAASKLSGKSTLKPTALAVNPLDVFRKPCIRGDDPEPHLFDLSIQTQDGLFDDNSTPWGVREGFKNLDGPKAHIGFEVYRSPVIKKNLDGTEEEILGTWRPGGHYSTGPVHPDKWKRIAEKEEDPYWDDIRGNGRLYYDYIIRPEARRRAQANFLDDD